MLLNAENRKHSYKLLPSYLTNVLKIFVLDHLQLLENNQQECSRRRLTQSDGPVTAFSFGRLIKCECFCEKVK